MQGSGALTYREIVKDMVLYHNTYQEVEVFFIGDKLSISSRMCIIDYAKLPQVVTHCLTLLSVFLPSIYLPVSIYPRQSDRCLSLLVALSFHKTSTMTRGHVLSPARKRSALLPKGRTSFYLRVCCGAILVNAWSSTGRHRPPAVVASLTSSDHQRREYRSIVFPTPWRCYESTDLRRTLSRWTARGREELL